MARRTKPKLPSTGAAILAAAMLCAISSGARAFDPDPNLRTDSPPATTVDRTRDASDKPPARADDRKPSRPDRTSDRPRTTSRSSDRRDDRDDRRERGGASVDIPLTAVVPLLQWALSSHKAAPFEPAGPYLAGQVVVELAGATPPKTVAAIERRHRLTEVDGFVSTLTGRMVLLEQLQPPDFTPQQVASLTADRDVLAAQPNYLFELQATSRAAAPAADPALQYAVAKLRLAEAHRLASGDKVLVGVVDSAVDVGHPELRGVIARSFDAMSGPQKPHAHGTAIAGLIAAHARLTGSAPSARILAAQAFAGDGEGAGGSSFYIVKAFDWTAANGARVINMSFAGPSDPALHRALEAAYASGVVLVAAAGNAGPKAPPAYPAAEPHVIAVTATDAQDQVFAGSNRGRYIEVAAPGVDLLVASPGGGYQLSSGTSLSAAEVSGIAALILERRPKLRPDAVRAALLAASRPLTAEGAFRPRLIDAYRAVAAP